MLYRGFDALFSNNCIVEFDFSHYEKQKSVILPQAYKEFLTRYKTGFNSLRYEYYLNLQMNMKIPLLAYHYEKDGIFYPVMDFFGINHVLGVQEDSDEELGLFSFMSTTFGGSFCLGVKKNDAFGKIFFSSWDSNKPIYLANNIGDFIRDIHSVFIHNNIEKESLYKNWGEDFWRIREDKSE